jgi:hypothetical protein
MGTTERAGPWRALTPDEYADVFPGLFTQSAFRLEQLDYYRSLIEEEPFARYRRGQPDDLAWRRPWVDQVAQAVAAGKTMTRVHVVTEPWSEYVTFELTRTYRPAVDVGEDIRIVPRGRVQLVDHDFWLTEEPGAVARMIYTPDGEWTGVDLTDDPAIVDQYRTWRAAAIEASVPLDTYLDSVRRRTA